MTNQNYIFRDKLKTPRYLSQFDVARIRKITKEATDEEFQEYMSCSIGDAKRILNFWEIAQVEIWDVEILKRFFHVWIYEDREMVSARIQASIHAGRLPGRFTPEEGLQWLESENVLIGMMGHWVRANARRRKGLPEASAPAAPECGDVAPLKSRQDTRLARLRELGGDVSQKNGELNVRGITKLVNSEAKVGAPARTEKTVRADVKAAYVRETESNRNGHFSGLASR